MFFFIQNSSIFGLPKPNKFGYDYYWLGDSELEMSADNFNNNNFVSIYTYVVAKPTLKKVSEWFVSNKGRFESLKYDVIMFLSS